MADPIAPSSISDLTDHTAGWDWENKHVTNSFVDAQGNSQNIAIQDIVEAGTVLIAAGPADLDSAIGNAGGIRIVPIGMVETAQISLNRPLSRIFEIGSRLSYLIPGRTVGGIALNRVLFDGPSLLKILYGGEIQSDSASNSKKTASFSSNSAISGREFALIGSGNIAMNLASAFFQQPVGLCFYFRDQQDQSVSQIYFEGCSVTTYNMGISANMNVLTEAVNMEFIRCRPIVSQATTEATTKGVDLTDANIVSAQTFNSAT